jgi:hypothetical protein
LQIADGDGFSCPLLSPSAAIGSRKTDRFSEKKPKCPLPRTAMGIFYFAGLGLSWETDFTFMAGCGGREPTAATHKD